ncbi:MAG: hypothetical protein AAB538_02910 [Patescibacteria group bacterium]
MLQPLSNFLHEKKGQRAWDESDARHFIQKWLRETTHTQHVYCERFGQGVATVRAASAAVRQEVALSEADLKKAFRKAGGRTLARLVVTQ